MYWPKYGGKERNFPNTPLSTAVAEIILVDDASQQAHLGAQLEAYVARLPVPVFIVRSTTRIGLIKARLRQHHHTAQGG